MSGEIRLVGGMVPNEGRVEFCQNGNWGTVCDDQWGAPDARVVCRQLGYTTTSKLHHVQLVLHFKLLHSDNIDATAFGNARFGAGTGSIYLDNVRCTGSETMLGSCTANRIGQHNCVHSEDASVRCQGIKT